MDEIVLRAMARWPNVPSVYGWLSLDRRGQWRIKGELIGNPTFSAFIGRNYHCDTQRRWYFQNGPQRVFVQLEYTPIVVRLTSHAEQGLHYCSHIGAAIKTLDGVWLDESGALLIAHSGVAALVADRDLAASLALLETDRGGQASDIQIEAFLDHQGSLFFNYCKVRFPIGRIRSSEVARHFGFIANPQPAPGEPDC